MTQRSEIPLEGLVVANALTLEALVDILVESGTITREQLLQAIALVRERHVSGSRSGDRP